MEAFILSIGDELVAGHTVDTNSAWLSRRLQDFGVRVFQHVTVGDDVEAARAAIRRGLADAELLIVTGGLGPTLDDLTREAIAAAIGVPLEESAEALAQVRAVFDKAGRSMPESNKVQALIPRGCRVLANQRGSAPGIGFDRGDLRLFALPGVPGEMKAMFEEHVAPAIGGRRGRDRVASERLACFGIPEASLGETLADLMVRGRNPTVGTTASRGILTVHVVARGSDGEEGAVCDLLEADLAEIRCRLGGTIFGKGEDTLQGAVGHLLIGQRQVVSTAESCTGGLLAKRLTDVPGSSAFFKRGYVTYSDEAKSDLLGVQRDMIARYGAVSAAVARAMASGCRSTSGSDLAMAITGIAGPTGARGPEKPVGLVFVALADADGVDVERILHGQHVARDGIRDRSCKFALNMLRLRLLG